MKSARPRYRGRRGTGVLQMVALLGAISIPALVWLHGLGTRTDRDMRQGRRDIGQDQGGWRPTGRGALPRRGGERP